MKKILLLVLLFIYLPLHAGQTVTVKGRSDASQSGLLIEADDAKAVVMLFPGGHGRIKLKADGSFRKLKGNFLVRSREYFLANNLHVLIMDAPSDKQDSPGMKDGSFRGSDEHRQDLSAMMTEIKKRYDLPLWLIGTSRGTESVANAMTTLGDQFDGAVLTASMTESNDNGPTVFEFDIENVSIPVMVAHHEDDLCWVTTPHGAKGIAEKLVKSKRVKLAMFTGGDDPVAGDCKGKSAHGFYGIEKQVVDAIAGFILTGG